MFVMWTLSQKQLDAQKSMSNHAMEDLGVDIYVHKCGGEITQTWQNH